MKYEKPDITILGEAALLIQTGGGPNLDSNKAQNAPTGSDADLDD